MSNRVKVTIHSGSNPGLRENLFAELQAGGYEPFSITDGSDPGDFCAAVSIFAPLPYVLIVNPSGNRAAAIAHDVMRSRIPNPCTLRVNGGRAA